MNLYRIGLSAAALLFCQSLAALGADGQTCASIADSLQRLGCYDSIFKNNSAPLPSASSAGWQLIKSKSPIDDSEILTAVLSAKSSTSGINSLVLRCSASDIDVFLSVGKYLVGQSAEVIFRINKDEAQTEHWGISTNHYGAGLSNVFPSTNPFLSSLHDNDQIFFRVVNDGDQIDGYFNLGNFQETLTSVTKACFPDARM